MPSLALQNPKVRCPAGGEERPPLLGFEIKRTSFPSLRPSMRSPMADLERDELTVVHADTVKSFRRIIEGEFDDLPEQAFHMRGGIEEVIEVAETMNAAV